MTLKPVLIAGVWRASIEPTDSFSAINPTNGVSMEESYPVSSMKDLDLAIEAAHEADIELREKTPEEISYFLETYADNLERNGEDITKIAQFETGLPIEPRLFSNELPRTVDQLRQASVAAMDRSWRLATIDSKTNIRSYYSPMDGPIIIFGPNNFPLAFNGVAGGDFAAAIATGNAVIAKANPNHPGTTRLLAEIAHETIKTCGLPSSALQMFYHSTPETGIELVSNPLVGAVAFTGSRKAGISLKKAAEGAGIPIYLEMSSINPVFILPDSLEERADEIAQEFTSSCTMGAGQFCTKPGIVILLENESSEAFVKLVIEKLENVTPGFLFNKNGIDNLLEAVNTLQAYGAQIVTGGHILAGTGYRFANSLLRVSGDVFLKNHQALQTEAFGAASLVVFAKDVSELIDIAEHLEGNLTGSIYTGFNTGNDHIYSQIEKVLRKKVGRLMNDKMPTGVTVSPAMVHGGPYPVSGHPGFTSVGIPASFRRFAALHCYDNVRPERLPPELQDKNPTGTMWRIVDHEWTQRDVI